MKINLSDLLARAPGSLIKDADIESPDEVQLESDFANMAFMFLRDRAPGLQPYLLGFEVVDREEDGSRAVGIFGFKISGNYYYVPVFFVNKQIKGMDLLFSKKTNSFVPLRETQINKILNQSTLRLGDPAAGSNKLREDFEQPNFDFLSRPPLGPKSAGLQHLFSAAELAKFAQEAELLRAPREVTVNPAPMQEGDDDMPAAPDSPKVAQAQPGFPAPSVQPQLPGQAQMGQPAEEGQQSQNAQTPPAPAPVLPDKPELPGNVAGMGPQMVAMASWQAGMGHDAWNAIQEGVASSMEKDAEFRKAFACAMAKARGIELSDLEKTAEDSPLVAYLRDFGGPRAVGALMRAVRGDVKFASSLLSFYPSVTSVFVSEFDASLAPKVKKADCCCVTACGGGDRKQLTDAEKRRLVRDGFAIVDRRPDSAKSETFDTSFMEQYACPSEGGRYNLLLPTGSAAAAWILHCKGGPAAGNMVVVEPKNRFFFTADEGRVFVRGEIEDGQTAYDAAIALDKMQPGTRYVLVNEKAACSAPFLVRGVVAESGKRVRMNVSFDTGTDHRNDRDSRSNYNCPPTCCDSPFAEGDTPTFLQLADHPGLKLRQSGTDLVVPQDWKALELINRYDYQDSVAPCDVPGPYPEAARDAARTLYDSFAPGSPIDVEVALGKSAIHRLVLESPDSGCSFYVHFDDFTEGPWTPKQAMCGLVGRYRMSVDDAESRMLSAARNFKDRCLIKLSQFGGVGVGINMPEDPGATGIDDGTGMPIQTPFQGQSQGELLGVPPLDTDTLRPGFAVGGQAESEIAGAGGSGDTDSLGDDVMMLAQQAAQTGQKHVFDHATIGGLAKLYDSSAAVDSYMPDLTKALDRLGRILFIFYWKADDFAERYGSEDLSEMEDMLRGVFKSYGDLVLKLQEKSVAGADAKNAVV